ncbi:MAG: winged helix-turn-helix transcriptional regulator [Mycoplasmataceae bacterium]|nr:winged helix-turn-helix transcriptional regulator [Mycoplasmataceae bacterium]
MTTHDVIKQLYSETKLALLYFIYKENSYTVSKFAKVTNRNVKNISKQLNEMEKAGILVSDKQGKEKYYSASKDMPDDIEIMIKSILKCYIKDEKRCQCLK